jgi:hypothetical protein
VIRIRAANSSARADARSQLSDDRVDALRDANSFAHARSRSQLRDSAAAAADPIEATLLNSVNFSEAQQKFRALSVCGACIYRGKLRYMQHAGRSGAASRRYPGRRHRRVCTCIHQDDGLVSCARMCVLWNADHQLYANGRSFSVFSVRYDRP